MKKRLSPRANVFVIAAASLLGIPASADPWARPGDASLRSDLLTLADAHALRAPVSTWPLRWADIVADLDAADLMTLDDPALAAYQRVMARAREEIERDRVTPHAAVAFAERPRVIRSFDDTPREDAQASAGLSLHSDRFMVRLNASRMWDPADGDTIRPDGSYIGVSLGNWTVSAGYPERWWGPGWDGSLILSTNARPIPQVTIDRTRSAPFDARWLRWIGPWSLSAFVGQLDDDRFIDDALLLGMRVTFKPLPGLEVGLSRTAQWCGDGRDCDTDTLVNVLLGRDNKGVNVAEDEEPGNQLAGFDVRWSPFEKRRAAFYLQWIGEDSRQGGPQIGSWLRLLGVELAGVLSRQWQHRTHVEVSDTTCREGGFGFSDEKPRCAYEHSIYRSGYRYKGRSIGHGLDGDGRSYTLGTTLTGDNGHVWRLSLRRFEINRTDAWFNTGHTLSPTPQDLSDITIMHTRPLRVGALRAALGYRHLDDRMNDALDDRSVFGWLEFVLN